MRNLLRHHATQCGYWLATTITDRCCYGNITRVLAAVEDVRKNTATPNNYPEACGIFQGTGDVIMSFLLIAKQTLTPLSIATVADSVYFYFLM